MWVVKGWVVQRWVVVCVGSRGVGAHDIEVGGRVCG